MTLAHRFYIFLIPVALLFWGWNIAMSWLAYKNQTQRVTQQAMAVNVKELQVVAKDPLFRYYQAAVDRNYLDYARLNLMDIQLLFRQVMKNARSYNRVPDHMILFKHSWDILILDEDSSSATKENIKIHKGVHIEPFYDGYTDFSRPFSLLNGDHHKVVIPLGRDNNHDGILTKGEVTAFLHSEFLLPIQDFRRNAFAGMIKNILFVSMQMVVMILLLWWIGRSAPRPLFQFIQMVGSLSKGNFDQDFAKGVKIHELKILANALNQMNTEIQNRQQALIKAKNQAQETNEKLWESQNKLDAIIHNTSSLISLKSLNGRFLLVNRQWERVLKKTQSDILGKRDEDIFPEESVRVFKANDKKVLESGYLLEFEETLLLQGVLRTYISVKFPIYGADKRLFALCSISTDITERKQLEEALKFSQFSVEKAKDATLGMDSTGKLFFVNEEACTSLMFSREHLTSLSIFDIAEEYVEPKWSQFWQILRKKRTMIFDAVHRKKTGATFPVEVSINFLEYQGREYAMAFARDVTERKKIQRELKHYANSLENMVQERTKQLAHAERLASLGTFAAGMAHEINNPNSFISGNVYFLKQFWSLAKPLMEQHKGEDSSGRIHRFMPEVEKTLDGMLDGSQRISKIIDSLKTYSKGGMETDKVECRLSDPIRDAQTLLVHRLKKGTGLDVRVSTDVVIVCDRQQMCQVFVNLFNNAMDAMDDAGMKTNRRIAVRAQVLEDHVWVRVIDNGPGIPEEASGKIFDPFYTTKGKTKGTGLGLSIVHGIVDDHRGQLTVFSDKNESGAEFLMILPTLKLYYKLAKNNRSSLFGPQVAEKSANVVAGV